MRTRREQRKIDRRTVWQYMFFAFMFTLTFILDVAGSVIFGQFCGLTAMIYGATPEMYQAVSILGCIVVIPGLVPAWYFAQDFIFEQ
jgi:hypothetical protein